MPRILSAALALFLAGSSASVAAEPILDAGDYVAHAAAADLFEIRSAQLAMSEAARPEIRRFANMLAQHHTGTSQQLAAAAGDMLRDAKLLPVHRQMMERLHEVAPVGFDRLYLSQQVRAHERALALHQAYAAKGDVPALRKVASAAIPIIEAHLNQARELSK